MKHLAFLLLLAAAPAFAHSAHDKGWEYDPECCHNEDCAPVPDSAIREIQGGYRVTIMPGTHPMVPLGSQPVDLEVLHGDKRIRVSGDGDKHACVGRLTKMLFCIYVPPGGV